MANTCKYARHNFRKRHETLRCSSLLFVLMTRGRRICILSRIRSPPPFSLLLPCHPLSYHHTQCTEQNSINFNAKQLPPRHRPSIPYPFRSGYLKSNSEPHALAALYIVLAAIKKRLVNFSRGVGGTCVECRIFNKRLLNIL